jgi:PiT family inorganic phosphate transporter
MALKGVSKLVEFSLGESVFAGAAVGIPMFLLLRPVIRRQSQGLENRTKSLKKLFAIPLVFSAALLSFAHGANDVANAVGPLAAIVHAVQEGGGSDRVTIPFWVMLIGGIGLSVGLLLFGPKLINIVGSEITRLNAMRAYCVALSAAITVIVASWLGLPVSSTHIAVGGVFGVGFFREWYVERQSRLNRAKKPKHKQIDPVERKRRKLVRRSHFMTIVAAWVVTVPAAALISALLYVSLRLVVDG